MSVNTGLPPTFKSKQKNERITEAPGYTRNLLNIEIRLSVHLDPLVRSERKAAVLYTVQQRFILAPILVQACGHKENPTSLDSR